MSPSWRPWLVTEQGVAGSVVFGDVIQVTHVDGDVTIITDQPAYRVSAAMVTPLPLSQVDALAQPSRLLLPRHQIVPFAGREPVLEDLASWIRAEATVAVRLIYAAGGQGKTRLVTEVAARCARAGWTVWQVTQNTTPEVESSIGLPMGAVLAVVDYADRWPFASLLRLVTQLQQLHLAGATVVRLLLVARSTGYWWSALADRIDSELQVIADELALGSLTAEIDLRKMFATAAARFAEHLGIENSHWPPPPILDGPAFKQVLAVHMAALATVDAHRCGDSPPTQPHGLSAYLLRRECSHWQHLHSRTDHPLHTTPQVMHRAAYTAALTGATPRPIAHQAMIRSTLAADVSAADRIIDDHRICYPPADPNTVLEALHPDRLAEDLIALSTPGHNCHTSLIDDWTLRACWQRAPEIFDLATCRCV